MIRDAAVVVVGAGVVGLAVAARLASPRRTVLVLERLDGIARETSSRNSGVIHAGLYYPDGSWKARTCVRGRELLYERCQARRIAHRRCGKLVVAVSEDEVGALEALAERGRANGVPGLKIVDASGVAERESCVTAVAGLLSPASGVVDAHGLALSYAAEAEAGGARIVLGAEVVALEPTGDGLLVEVRERSGARTPLRAGAVVNAAGLAGDRVAALAGLDPDHAGLRIHPCKGDYFALAPGAPLRFSGLVYPVAHGAGLGVHVTEDLGGRIRLGPDAEYVDAPRYDVDPTKAGAFAAAASRYLRGLREEWLSPDQAGVRPKLAAPGEGFRDFVIREESAFGAPGLVDLVGIESPGLTAAGAIAEEVERLLLGSGNLAGP